VLVYGGYGNCYAPTHTSLMGPCGPGWCFWDLGRACDVQHYTTCVL